MPPVVGKGVIILSATRISKIIYISVICGTVMTMLVGFAFSFAAGCAGDTKSGIFGNPRRALELEDAALPWMLGAALLAGASYGLSPRIIDESPLKRIQRLVLAIAIMLLCLPTLWFLGINVESLAVSLCH